MGTFVSISLPQEQLALSSPAFKRLQEVEKALSSYDTEAEIYKLNHQQEVEISSDTYEALVLSKQYYKDSNTYFDISIGSITKGLFHFGENESVPSPAERLRARIDLSGLHFNKQKAWIAKGITIDLGGMGKGFGVDKAVDVLKNKGIEKGVVALSGDIYCFHQCDMAIQDPFSPEAFVHFTMAQTNTSISTSGNYRRYVKSKDNSHLINPKTKSSQKSFSSITLISRTHSNADLDAYATAASVMPRYKAFTFLNRFEDIAYVVMDESKKIYKSKNLEYLVKELSWKRPADLHERVYIKVAPLIFQKSRKK